MICMMRAGGVILNHEYCFPMSLKDLTNLKMVCGGFPIFVLESEFSIQKRDLGTI